MVLLDHRTISVNSRVGNKRSMRTICSVELEWLPRLVDLAPALTLTSAQALARALALASATAAVEPADVESQVLALLSHPHLPI